MKRTIVLLALVLLNGCIAVGEFTPERHAQHELGTPDCAKRPDRCVENTPW